MNQSGSRTVLFSAGDYERLKKAGVPVQYTCFAGQIHCLLGLPPEAIELRELDRLITATMHKALRKQ